MTITEMFAILPYLKISSPVTVRGIKFHNSNDLDTLPDQSIEHLKTLFSLFFLRTNHRIKEMVYSHLDFTSSSEMEFHTTIKRLRQAHILIGYLYSSPQQKTEKSALDLEHSSLYLFNTFRLSNVLIWPDENVEDITGRPPLSFEEMHEWSEGYAGLVNWNEYIWVREGSRIFPKGHNLNLHPYQDLHRNIEELKQFKYNWAIEQIIDSRGDDPSPLEQRLFTAIEWYNRNNASDIPEEVALTYLAIAFECLLNLDQGEELSKRFKESVVTLLGPVPRLDSWLEQFYKARSGIVHKGVWPHLRFYPVDKDSLRTVYKESESGVIYRSLTSYGRRIFRACLSAILSGSQLAHSTRLSSLFVHNQERLQRMCQKLTNLGVPPEKRIGLVQTDVVDLNNSWFESEGYVRGDTVLGVAERLAQAYLDASPHISEEALNLLKEAINQTSENIYDQFDKYIEFDRFVQKSKGYPPRQEFMMSDDPLRACLQT